MERTLIIQSPEKISQEIKIYGWVHSRRDHGKIVFLDVRDRSGLIQVVTSKDCSVGIEDVVEIVGKVNARPENLKNPQMVTGNVELEATSVVLLNSAQTLPFPIDTNGYDINEEVRLKYRYLDLRRPRLQKNLHIRSNYVQAAREFLFSQDFTEIETPLLTKSTPEGSRDFVVPSRLQPGKFFALPQSPQQYKQLLMTAGFERYFQIARCMRDEDPRADRGFEHTQIDIEMSFVTREEVMKLVEDMTIFALEKIGAQITAKPFPVVTYQEALEKYGTDKFDLRTDEEKKAGTLSFTWVVDYPFFEKTESGSWTFTHNPFSQPKPEHLEWLLQGQNIDQILTTQYDLVCNGHEVSGGSIRSHQSEVLQAVFKIMGYGESEIQEKFGHMLSAFKFGTPPHGGCAQGLERLLMTYLGENYIREVQAFPQTGRGRTSVMDAPSPLFPDQMAELGITLISTSKPDQSVFAQIQSKLNGLNIAYECTEHEPVYTSEQAAKVRGSRLQAGAKALIMYADLQPIMVVVSAATKVDTKVFKKLYGIKKLKLATPEEVEKITQVKIGAVPPFGSLFHLDTFVDNKLAGNDLINFNAGKHDTSIQMKYNDFIRAELPELGNFSK